MPLVAGPNNLRQLPTEHRSAAPCMRAAHRRSVVAPIASSRGDGTSNGNGNGNGKASTSVPPAPQHRPAAQPHKYSEDSEETGRSRRPFLRRFTKEDYDTLPHRIILVRHAESMGNVAADTYCTQPDHTVVLTERGRQQALDAGQELASALSQAHGSEKYRVFIMTSPYHRTVETTDLLLEAFTDEQVVGVRSAVQLREQDFGNFQDPQRISQDMSDRLRFGRFWFRFPNGESGADVYDRITIFEDHLTRDMLMGRFTDSSVVLVTHGLTMRLFLMRWFHWSVEEMLRVFNPGNAIPLTLEKLPWEVVSQLQNNRYVGVKQCFAITPQSLAELRGCTRDMASYLPRNLKDHCAKSAWKASRMDRGPYNPEEPPASEEISGNWLYGYYCSKVPQPTQQHSSWANTGTMDEGMQSEDEAAEVLEAISRRDSGAASEDVPLAATAAAEVAAAAHQEMGHAQP